MAYFDCIVGGSGKGNTLVVTCADDLAGATITCTNGTKTYTKTCPSTAPYEVTFYGLAAGTWTVSATVSGNTYTATVVITDYEAELGGFSWRRWVDTASQLDSTDYASLSEVLADEEAVRELCLEHACVDYLASIATTSEDVETIINNDLFAKWVNNSDYALDFLGANVVIKALMDEADKYGYGEWCLIPQVPTMTSNTAPYGEAIDYYNSSSNPAYHAFSADDVFWGILYTKTTTGGEYIGYHFIAPIKINAFYFKGRTFDQYYQTQSFKIQASNTGNTNDWVDVSEEYTIADGVYKRYDFDNDESYSYYRLYFTRSNTYYTGKYTSTVKNLQFYAYAPKGNVPVMTSDTAPYGTASASNQNANAYQAFNGSDSGYNGGSSAYSGTITYAFTNPICPSKVSFRNNTNTDGNVRVYTYKVEGYDGTSWEDLTETLSVSDRVTVGALTEADISTTKYYTQLRLNMLSGSQYIGCAHLQFYGRELSVSVPKMDTNTTPYGEASASSGNNDAHYAFNGANDNGWISANNTSDQYLTYDFKKEIEFSAFSFWYSNSVGGAATISPTSVTILTSLDGSEFTPVNTYSFSSNATHFIKLSVNISARYIRAKVNGYNQSATGANRCIIGELQFYGLDYSEKEFEEGATKKWLYDHGVELETIATGGTVTVEKRDSDIKINDDTTSAYGIVSTPNINFTNFQVVRAKFGDEMVVSSSSFIRVGNTISSTAILAGQLPYNNGLNISSVTDTDRTYIAPANTGNTGLLTLTEWWLE